MNKKNLIILLSFVILFLFITACNEKSKIGTSELEGIAIFNKDENLILDYIPSEKKQLSQVLEKEITGEVYIINSYGSVYNVSPDIYLDSDSNTIYAIDNSIIISEDIVGIYIGDDYYSITDVYHDAKTYLDNGEKAMVVLLDGFSLEQYKLAEEMGILSFLNQHFKNEALSVFTPVTNAGFAAMITGQTPDINGVHDRSFRTIKIDSIFDYALKNQKKSALLEADIKILNTEIEPLLHIDTNSDGDIDDEIYNTAKVLASEDYDFIFIHFHGIDDRGHTYGPKSFETMNYIGKIDGYLEEISSIWNGPIILTADHGMHETEDGGNHGICINEDMVVPYFKKEQ